jgi:outer membrane protein insertion porin family
MTWAAVLLFLCQLGAFPGRTEAADPATMSGPSAAEPSGMVTSVDVDSPHQLPDRLVQDTLAGLAGRPFSRHAIRESLDRLWALGLLSRAEVDAISERGGVRLRYRFERSPYLARLAWEGDLGVPRVDLAAAAGLLLGGPADATRLARAEVDVRALYAREGYFGAVVTVTAPEDTATAGRDVVFHIQAGDPADIGHIRVIGAPGAGALGLLRAFGLRQGERYRQGRVDDGIRAVETRLRELGYYEARVTRPTPAWDRNTNRVALDIDVEEGRRTRLAVTGSTALDEAALRARLTFGDAGVVDEVEVRASARRMETAFHEIGYPFAVVTGTLARDGEDRVANFAVTEGPRVTVEAVDFTGDTSIPANRLRDQMQTRPPDLLHRGLFSMETLDSDLLVLLRYYRAQGFPEAAVGPAAVAYNAERTRARISIPIAEGPRRRVGAIAVTGERAIGAPEILAAVPLRRGDPYDRVRVDDGRRLIERLYARHGYQAAAVSPSTAIRDGEVDVTYAVVEGEPTRIGRILVGGLTATRDDVVLRELPFSPGQLLDPDDLAEARRRLAATRLFERADIGPLRAAAGPYQDLEIFVREARPWRLDFGLGYQTEDGFRGYIEIANDNLFGTGRSLSLRERASQRGDLTELTYREPWLLGTPWQGQLIAFRQQQEEVGYSFESFGGAASLEQYFINWPGNFLRGAATYSLREVRRFDIQPGLVQEGITGGTERLASVLGALSWDRREPQADPKHGSFHLATVETADSLLGSQSNYVKTQFQTSWFVPWPPPTLLAMSLRLGLAWPFGDSDSLPIQTRFFAGGTTTVRGYTLNAIGPRDTQNNPLGGNGQVIANIEWRFPIWRWFGGAVFLDTGVIASEVRDILSAPVFPGAGAGLRIATPIGPIRLDIGYALRRIPGENPLQFYLTVGQAF